ncbi:hypothetical protein J2Z48_002667 [Croceifilum oryzae]|uniref:Uncharacterized protein n=1 Tax=Croceifilum oryzae TaxID=1553429 RepID=A0AAJ1TGK4_9BACL|nr:hypothetical protein [Croceifilum oryzae]MDQ0418475.1 hypothetical protein [Croceifilum oryzae]
MNKYEFKKMTRTITMMAPRLTRDEAEFLIEFADQIDDQVFEEKFSTLAKKMYNCEPYDLQIVPEGPRCMDAEFLYRVDSIICEIVGSIEPE